MIIVSQDERKIVNFDNIYYIDYYKIDGTYEIDANTDKDSTFLGCYKTEERAKEVLQEIMKKYRDVTVVCDINNNKYEKYDLPKVFEMPKE